MQQLRINHGVPVVLGALRFLSIRLKSRPQTAGLAPDVDAMRALLRDKDDAYAEAREQRIAASAEITYLDTLVDDAVMAASRELLVLTGGKADDPRYLKPFPTAPSAALKPVGGASQDRFVKGVIVRFREDPDLAPLAGHAPKIEAAQADLEKGVAQRNDLHVKEAMTLADRRIALEDARRMYNLTYPRLQLIFPNKPTLVESFFKDLRGEEAEAASEAKADAPAPEKG
jgi:hypothetical protein